MNSQTEIEKELAPSLNQDFICPDGQTRKLLAFECVENTVVIQFKGGHLPEYSFDQFWQIWDKYQPVRDGFAVSPAPASPPVELTQTTTTVEIQSVDAVVTTQKQAKEVMDTSDMVKMLSDQMKKVASGNPAAVDQAHAMSNLARQILEAGKLKLNIMKVVHQINQPAPQHGNA